MMWPGGFSKYRNVTIQYLQNFNMSIPWHSRIDTVVNWLTDPLHPANCVFVYFENPDTIVHSYGPFSPQAMHKVREADDILGYLVEKLEKNYFLAILRFLYLLEALKFTQTLVQSMK